MDGAQFGNCSEVMGQQIALCRARGDILFFTNSDVFVPADWMQKHLEHYPGTDMVLGPSANLPINGLLSLSFQNFSCRKEVIDAYPLNETRHQDLDLALRIWKNRKTNGFRWDIDNSIPVSTYDNPVSGEKAFRYLMNITILYRKYGVLPLPPAVPLKALKNVFDRPEKIAGALAGALMPFNHTVGRRTKHR